MLCWQAHCSLSGHRAQEGLRPTVDPGGHKEAEATGAVQGLCGGWELQQGFVLVGGAWGRALSGQCDGLCM